VRLMCLSCKMMSLVMLEKSFGIDDFRFPARLPFGPCNEVGCPPGPSLPPAKALMARFLCWHIQEQAKGGLDPETGSRQCPRPDNRRADGLGKAMSRKHAAR
jgi:hypothetical protein